MLDKSETMHNHVHHFENKSDLLVVWLFSSLSFMSMNNLVGFFAILASVTSIIRNIPYLNDKLFKYKKDKK